MEIHCSECGTDYDASCPSCGTRDWDITYRTGDAGEIEAVVEADTLEEAIDKFLKGDVKSEKVNYWVLHRDFVEASPTE